MITFQIEKLTKGLQEELYPLFEKHKEEVGVYSFLEMSPDWKLYELAETNDLLRPYFVRKGGELIGYVWYLLASSLHYSGLVFAEMDLVYLKEEYRNQGIAKRLLEFAEKDIKDNNKADIITMRMKTWAPFEELAESLEYDRMELGYTKYLGV